MSAIGMALLDDRGIIRIGGPDAGPFLQGLITNDMALMETQLAINAGLLSPQGKVLFEFLVVKAGEGFVLDVARGAVPDLVKRLSMYKLRAKVEIEGASAAPDAMTFLDPRLLRLGSRAIVSDPATVSAAPRDYDAHRIALGVPEGGKDYAFGDLFPHEAMFDQLNGVSFTKGCYVGQEIVARMQHRGTARSRFLIVDADGPLPPLGTPIVVADKPLGAMGSNAGRQGLALIRLDRLADAYTSNAPITTAGVPVRLAKPAYATFEVPAP